MDIEKVLEGGIITGAGALVGTASNTLLPEKYKNYGYLAAGAIGLYGLYTVAKGVSEPPAEICYNETFGFNITAPEEGSEISIYLPINIINITATITSTHDKKCIGIWKGIAYKDSIKMFDMQPTEIKIPKEGKVIWSLVLGYFDTGNYQVRMWIENPVTGEIQGEDTVNFIVKIL